MISFVLGATVGTSDVSFMSSILHIGT